MSPELRTILLAAVTAALVVAGPRLGFGNRRLPAGLRLLSGTGTLFIVIGALIGPAFLGIVSREDVRGFGPVIDVCLGWLGFLFGSHFEVRRMMRFPLRLYGAAMWESAFTMALVGAAAWFALPALAGDGFPAGMAGPVSMLLAICAGGTAPAGLFLMSAEKDLDHAEAHVLKFISAMDDLLPMLFIGILYAFYRPESAAGAVDLPGWVWLPATAGLGVVLGIVGHRLFPKSGDVRENSLVLMGVVAVGGGAASLIGASALFCCAVAGFVFANLSTRKESAYGLLAEREHTLYAVFLLTAGLMLEPRWDMLYIILPSYVLLRAAGKVAGLYSAGILLLPRPGLPPLAGGAMLFDGGIVLAVAVAFQRTHGSDLTQTALTAVVLGVIINELIAPAAASAVLTRARRAA